MALPKPPMWEDGGDQTPTTAPYGQATRDPTTVPVGHPPGSLRSPPRVPNSRAFPVTRTCKSNGHPQESKRQATTPHRDRPMWLPIGIRHLRHWGACALGSAPTGTRVTTPTRGR